MVVAIIQARSGSIRLPGKILMKIQNKPILYYVINQVQHSKKITKIIVATTKNKQDDQIVNFSSSFGIDIFRGDENDVLDRYYQCAKELSSKIFVRITSDCPLIDPNLIDCCIDEFTKNNYDYFSNIHKKDGNLWTYNPSGYPMGFAVEVFSFDALKTAWINSKKLSEREHVTLYILNHPEKFKIGNIENTIDHSDIRLTLDHKEDFDLIKIVIEHFPKNEIFNLQKIISFIENKPKLKNINSKHDFNEGLVRSLKEDKTFENIKKIN